ncbi:MAG TPA: hypothetical protein VKY73_03125 [Polyangiaceae bacterium]|nr:hypothetical protein [Polyangiaceae bacterium]
MTAYRVFAQAAPGTLDPAAIVRTATRFFATDVTVLGFHPPGVALDAGAALEVALSSRHPGAAGKLRVRARAATVEDLEAARRAEQRGRSSGMSLLAERCPSVWEITELDAEPRAAIALSGILAAVGLGPVLPPDESALFGVRGALERLERPLP